MTARFRAFPQLRDPERAPLARLRHRLDARAHAVFASEGRYDRLARALADRRALHVKELVESAELFERIRKRVVAPRVADLCCGHGLTGILYALWGRGVEEVVCLDRRRPASHDLVLAAAADLDPTVVERVRFLERPVEGAGEVLAPGTAVVAVHACGARTDRCLDVAIALGGPVAVLPCCYGRTASDAPRAVRKALGAEVCTDVHRTYRLQAAGYQVEWDAIPEAVTPMCRVVIGWHGGGGGGGAP